jgi:hypothetical protein
MEIYYDIEQGTPEWFAARAGIPTASMYAAVMAQGKGGAPSKTRRTYMLKLAGERLTGEPSESYSNQHTERGHEHEPLARNAYAFFADAEPVQVGFIRSGGTGASPDALVGDSGLLEIKSKLPHLHLDVLLEDKAPAEHIKQIQGQLWVAEREWCDFVSYCPRLPLFCKRVYRDEEKIAEIAAAVAKFNDELEEIVARFQGSGVEF